MNWQISIKLLLSLSLIAAPVRYIRADDGDASTTTGGTTASDGSAGDGSAEDLDSSKSDQIALSDEKCPMVDDRPYGDLRTAVDALASKINPAKCEDPSDKALLEASQNIIKTKDALSHEWSEFDKVGDPANADVNIPAFTGNIDLMINSLKQVGDELGRGSLNNKSCVKKMNSLSILAALGDVATSLAPFALLGASMNPSWKASVKGIIGLTGIGSAAKVLRQVGADDQKMDTASDREQLLKNICEFTKLDRRLRRLDINRANEFGKSALEQFNEDIHRKDQSQQRILTRLMSTTSNSQDISAYLAARKVVLANLLAIEKQLKRDRDAFRQLTGEYGTLSEFIRLTKGSGATTTEQAHLVSGMTDDQRKEHSVGLCVKLNGIFANQEEIGAPFTADTNMKNLVSLMAKANVDSSPFGHVDTLLRTSTQLRSKFKEVNAECEKYAFPFLENLKSILNNIRMMSSEVRTAIKSANNLKPQMATQKAALLKYQQDEERIERERVELIRLKTILENLRSENASIDVSEMSDLMKELYRGLFSEGHSILEKTRKPAPALAWLRQIQIFHLKASGDFKASYQKEVLNHAKNFPIDKSVKKKVPAGAFPMLSSSLWQNISFWWNGDQKKIDNNLEAAKMFPGYNIQNLPMNSSYRLEICKNLTNLQRQWINAWDHLIAQRYFCKQIKPVITNEADINLLNYCQGIEVASSDPESHSTPKYEKNPEIQDLIVDWDKDTKEIAKVINDRMTELQCKARSAGQPRTGGPNVGGDSLVDRPLEKR